MSNGGEPNNFEDIGTTSAAADIIAHCTSIVEDFRNGEIGKSNAISALAAALADEKDFSSLPQYISLLTEAEEELAEARRRGGEQNGEGLERRIERNFNSNGRRSHSADANNVQRPTKRKALVDRIGRRTRSVSPSNSDNPSDSDSDDTSDKFAWSAKFESQYTNDVTIETHRLKVIYTRDPKKAKRSVLATYRAPWFPDSLWNDLLANRFVDLDRVFSSSIGINADAKDTHTLGDFEITHGNSAPSHTIRSSGDWVAAWGLYSQAVCFAYPHRQHELSAYFTYINATFIAVNAQSVSNVINFDKAARKFVAGSSEHALDQTTKYGHLHTRFFAAVGAGSSDPGSSRGGRSGGKVRNRGQGHLDRSYKREEPCGRWNAGRGCNEEACIYAHSCMRCGGRHRRVDCRTDAREKTEK